MVNVLEKKKKKIEFEVVTDEDGVTEIIEVRIDDVIAVKAGGAVDVDVGGVVAVLRTFGKSFHSKWDTKNKCENNNKSNASIKVSVSSIKVANSTS